MQPFALGLPPAPWLSASANTDHLDPATLPLPSRTPPARPAARAPGVAPSASTTAPTATSIVRREIPLTRPISSIPSALLGLRVTVPHFLVLVSSPHAPGPRLAVHFPAPFRHPLMFSAHDGG